MFHLRSTKQTDRSKALSIASEWERVDKKLELAGWSKARFGRSPMTFLRGWVNRPFRFLSQMSGCVNGLASPSVFFVPHPVLEPIFETEFAKSSNGFRPGRGAIRNLEAFPML